jgi:ubiquinone/menaquinone biosynthesis C-methylase UbiE
MNPQPNFDRVARIYRWSEYLALGPLLQRTRTHFLPQLTHCRNALLLGDGDGRFLAALLASNPELHAVTVDTSAAMLQLLHQRCERIASSRLQTIQASALEVAVPPATDLVTTHFFLDCLTQTEVDQLVQKIAAHTQSGMLWVLSDFAVPASRIARPLAKLYIRALYLAFRILTGLRVQSLPDPQAALTRAGFTCIARKQILRGLIYTEIWQRT